MRFITGGGLRIDYLITHDSRAETDMVGGNALYAAVGAALWTDEVHLWARAGENYPQAWLEELPPQGVNIDGVVRVPGHQDHRTFFAYTPDGRRLDTDPAYHFGRINQPLPPALRDYVHSTPGQDDPYQYEPLALRPGDWPAGWIPPVAVNLSPAALSTHRHVVPTLRSLGVNQITVDPGERYMIPRHAETIRQFLPQVDAFLPSDQEIYSLFGDDADLWQAAATLCRWGAPLVVVKNGANGVLVQEGVGGRRTHLLPYHPPGDPRIVDVTGAGDSFCGGFMVGLAKTGDPLTAARMGAVSSSYVIEGYGALYALSHSPDRQARLAAMVQRS